MSIDAGQRSTSASRKTPDENFICLRSLSVSQSAKNSCCRFGRFERYYRWQQITIRLERHHMTKDQIKAAKTSALVALYNSTVPVEKHIKKFVNRAEAERRVGLLWTAPKPEPQPASAPALASSPAPAKKDAPAPAKKDAPASTSKKQNTPPHLNLRCPVCKYYAKTTPACLKLARLRCPVDVAHGILKTAEERGEKRGR